MTNQIIEGISNALFKEFGEEYEIHMEEIKQGLKEPCFFVSCLNPNIKRYPGKRYMQTNQFCIQYFPREGNEQRECNDVAERMMWTLEFITVEDFKMHGTNMNYEVVDGVLNFFVNYDGFLRKIEEQEKIETIEVKENVKG